jgi:hypothetical protein
MAVHDGMMAPIKFDQNPFSKYTRTFHFDEKAALMERREHHQGPSVKPSLQHRKREANTTPDEPCICMQQTNKANVPTLTSQTLSALN